MGSLLADWPGPVLNLCGTTSPVTSALVMTEAKFYLGHDSGPMHLAALVGIRCVAIFSARAKPGVWFPHGNGHEVLYPWHEADGVPPKTGLRTAGGSIMSITVDDVVSACKSSLMCGIAGLAGRRPVNEDTVHMMTDLLVHRGPDDYGYWSSSNGNICLGHRRLSIIDRSAGGSSANGQKLDGNHV